MKRRGMSMLSLLAVLGGAVAAGAPSQAVARSAPASAHAVPAVPPGPPTGVTATVSNNVVTLTWTPPVGQVDGYDVFSSSPYLPSAPWPNPAEIIVPAPATGTTWANLQQISQTFTVDAFNSSGTGPASSPTAAVTPGPPDGNAPSAPTAVSAAPGVGSVKLTWTAPSSVGGSAIASYVLTSSGGARMTVPVSPTSAVFPGLGSGPHAFSVDAVNSTSTSPAGISNTVSPEPGGTYHPLVPARILDTPERDGRVHRSPRHRTDHKRPGRRPGRRARK